MVGGGVSSDLSLCLHGAGETALYHLWAPEPNIRCDIRLNRTGSNCFLPAIGNEVGNDAWMTMPAVENSGHMLEGWKGGLPLSF
jgi:hypothetical protein